MIDFKIFVLVLAGFLYCLPSMAQAEKEPVRSSAISMSLEGMVGLSANAGTLAVTVGGPNARLRLNKSLSIGAGALPSLFISQERTEPKLGLSPRVDYKQLVLLAPVYHFNNPNRWIWTFGLGYKFSSH